MKDRKPTKAEVENFNREYDKVIAMKKRIELEFKELISEAQKVDDAADVLYWKTNGNEELGMFYEDENGMLKCISKSVARKIENLDWLRDYSIGFHI